MEWLENIGAVLIYVVVGIAIIFFLPTRK